MYSEVSFSYIFDALGYQKLIRRYRNSANNQLFGEVDYIVNY